MTYSFACKTVSLNTVLRLHWSTRFRWARTQKAIAYWMTKAQCVRPKTWPLVVTLTRIAPSAIRLDDDNLRGALKSVRDGIAAALGVDDGDTKKIIWEYEATRGDYRVQVTIREGGGHHDRK